MKLEMEPIWENAILKLDLQSLVSVYSVKQAT